MQKLKSFAFLCVLGSLAFVTSCGGDDDPVCKKCDLKQEIYIDDELFADSETLNVQFCDNDLKQIEDNPQVTNTVNLGGMVQKTITTYTCK